MTKWFSPAFWTRNETLVAGVILLFCLVATLSDPRFFTITTVSDLLRAAIVIGILAVGAMLVLVSGGIDVSFTAVAVFAMYSSTLLSLGIWPDMPWPNIYLIAVVNGAALGAINGYFHRFSGPADANRDAGHPVNFPWIFVDLYRLAADLRPAASDAGLLARVLARGTTDAGNFYSISGRRWRCSSSLF